MGLFWVFLLLPLVPGAIIWLAAGWQSYRMLLVLAAVVFAVDVLLLGSRRCSDGCAELFLTFPPLALGVIVFGVSALLKALALAKPTQGNFMSATQRPPFIAHAYDGLGPLKDGGNLDMGGRGFPMGKALGLTKIGIHYEIQAPGSRSSFPHAESEEDEFVLVLKGRPDVWIDGVLHPLEAGDSVAFPAGTGIAHSFLNNADEDMHLLVIGEANKDTNRINYPLEPRRNAIFARRGKYWADAPQHALGPHDGKAVAGSRAAGPVDRSGRPGFIVHVSERLQPVTNREYSNFGGQHAALGFDGGLTRLGINHVVLPPGNRTSNPHAESLEDEFILVLEGKPDVWVDGLLHELNEGDGVAFPAGTGIAHTFLNNSDADVHLLVIGQHEVPGNQLNYPLQPERNADFATRGEYWEAAPKHDLGPHDGKARAGTRK